MRVVLVVVLLLTAACARTPKGTVVVEFDEFSVKTEPTSSNPGRVRFDQRNRGSVEHELVVIKTGLAPEDLPVRKVDVDLTAKTLNVVIHDRRLGAGDRRTIGVRLQAGDYVLICNVPGHYQSGMRTAFDVR